MSKNGPMLILLGLFLVAAIWRNKELSDDPEGKNTGVFTFFVIMSILLICRGAGFVLPLANTNNTGLFPLVPALVVFCGNTLYGKWACKDVCYNWRIVSALFYDT